MTKLSRAIHAAFILILFNGEVWIFTTNNTLKRTIMKIKTIVCSMLAASLLVGCACEKSEHHNKEAKQAKLMAEAKVSKDDAEKTALAKVPNGVIKEAELEKEDGKLQWSFDVATTDSKEITEVNVDAITGAVISAKKESTEDAEDAAKDKKEKKGGDKD
jgi:uncharacterized membrane protein YkoI